MPLRWIGIVGLVLLVIAGLIITDEKPLTKTPEDVQQAEITLTKWLDGFRDQTREEIQKSLGNPSTETTWLFKEKKELLLKYKIGKTTEMSLHFFRERVASVSLVLIPTSDP